MNGERPLPMFSKGKEAAPVPSNARFADYLQEWPEIKRKTCKESIGKEYERLSSFNLLSVLGEKNITDISSRPLACNPCEGLLLCPALDENRMISFIQGINFCHFRGLKARGGEMASAKWEKGQKTYRLPVEKCPLPCKGSLFGR